MQLKINDMEGPKSHHYNSERQKEKDPKIVNSNQYLQKLQTNTRMLSNTGFSFRRHVKRSKEFQIIIKDRIKFLVV